MQRLPERTAPSGTLQQHLARPGYPAKACHNLPLATRKHMTTLKPLELVGRSSSHFTRVTRMFALELGVPHAFRPVLDLRSVATADYAGNPALKVPILVDAQGPLFGAENICRELVRRSAIGRDHVVLRGDLAARAVANAEELTLHVMSAEVALLMAKAAGSGHAAAPKVSPSLENSLRYLEQGLDATLAALPSGRTLSFLEVTLFCVVTHLTFREVMDVAPYARLNDFCTRFGQRPSACATPYCFDAGSVPAFVEK
jgi:glutathione S-transferase